MELWPSDWSGGYAIAARKKNSLISWTSSILEILQSWIQPIMQLAARKCNNTGYSGRLALQEIFMVDNEIKDMIASGATEEKLEAAAREKGDAIIKGRRHQKD